LLFIASRDGDGFGIGSWGLMANPWGFDGTQLFPPHLCAFSKILLGWLTPKEVEYGTNFVSAMSILEPKHSQVIKISYGFPEGEYLLVENRQSLGFDRKVPDGGLVIFHVDEKAASFTQGFPGQKGWPTNGKHYQIAVLQADGAYELEQKMNKGGSTDAFRAGYLDSLLPSTNVNSGPFPNTDAYQGGKVYPTTNAITSISRSNVDMSFIFTTQNELQIFPDPELPSTDAPSSPPSRMARKTKTIAPSPRPSFMPSAMTQCRPNDGLCVANDECCSGICKIKRGVAKCNKSRKN
jgi:hypothetical protein